MNEIDFRIWMTSKNIKKKIQSDYISRVKRIERELKCCDIDEEYQKDRCEYIMSLFRKMGKNENMKKYPNINLPIGKYYMGTYRHAIKQYIYFRDETASISTD